jgi:hypothetical protein
VWGGGEGAWRLRKFCAALGLVQNKVIDEKILEGRVLGCHSDIVSAAQTVRRPSTLKLVKKSRFLAPKPAKYPRSHATKPKKSPGFDWLFVWHAREAPHMQTYGHRPKHRVQTRVSCEAPSGRQSLPLHKFLGPGRIERCRHTLCSSYHQAKRWHLFLKEFFAFACTIMFAITQNTEYFIAFCATCFRNATSKACWVYSTVHEHLFDVPLESGEDL